MSEDWSELSKEEKREKLIEQEKHLLKTFRERDAITEEDYEKSLRKLTEKT